MKGSSLVEAVVMGMGTAVTGLLCAAIIFGAIGWTIDELAGRHGCKTLSAAPPAARPGRLDQLERAR